MEYDRKLLQDVKRLMIARYPRFGAQIAAANLEYKTDLKYHTAATDGKNIYFDPDYLASLSDDDKLFIIAHELMHVKFEHMYRIMGKDGLRRDPELWNQATDAIINANLERDGFKIKEGYVNMPDALNYSAEEFYEKLLREKQAEQQQQQSGNRQNQSQNGQQNKQDGQGGIDSPWKGHNGDYQGTPREQSQNNEQNSGSNQQNKNGQNSNNNQSGNEQAQSQQGAGSSEQFADDHSLWEKAFEESQKQSSSESEKNKAGKKASQENDQSGKEGKKDSSYSQNQRDNKGGIGSGETTIKSVGDLGDDKEIEREARFDEKTEFQKNRAERRERAKQQFERMKNQELKKFESGNIEFGDIGEAKPILDWKLLLRREVEKTETLWSQRKSIAENNYAYRLKENDEEDEAETEVMIDVSGSVSNEMVRSFLRQLKPILKNSKLKVGFFADYATKEFQVIKADRDINNLKIYKPGYGTNMDAAVRAFSKKHETNKIIFTDGYPGQEPKNDLKDVNVIWLVYENRNFHPCCGKVIDVYPKDLQNLINAERAAAEPELSM